MAPSERWRASVPTETITAFTCWRLHVARGGPGDQFERGIGVAYVLQRMLGFLRRTLTVTLDFDWLYRVLFAKLAHAAEARGDLAADGIRKRLFARGSAIAARFYRHHGPEGMLARTWPTGSMALWVMIMLLAYLLICYL